MRRLVVVPATVLAMASLVACGDDDSASEGTITVFAAASLTDAFAEIVAAFEDANQGVTIQLNLAGSTSLREQILEGAPADVYASANESTMDQLVEADEVEGVAVFATNRLQIVVPAGNPAGVTGLDDLGEERLLIGLCVEAVPCGDFGRRALAAAGVTPAPDTNEADVRALLTKVEAGELDAGLVYVTDVIAAGDRVEGIDIPDEFNVVATYPIGTVATSGNPEVAASFVEFVLSDEGAVILEQYGFGPP